MTLFTIYPAIDLRRGRVVRLQQGDPNRQTVFGDDPVAVAERWIAAGAGWLHVVNLDGAFDDDSSGNWKSLPRLTALGARVQFGGGLRSTSTVERALAAGVSRVILGTAAVENLTLVQDLVQRFGADTIVVGVDASDGHVKTRGWQAQTDLTAVALGRQLVDVGITTIIYTDIHRDGILTGVNSEATAQLAEETGLRVIASGGVADLSDILRCAQDYPRGVTGVIVGRALYEGEIDLAAALSQVRTLSV